MCRSSFAATAALALAVGCSKTEAPAQAKSSSGGPPPAVVQLGTVGAGELTTGWRFLGRVEPSMAAEVAAAVDGHVRAIKVRVGDAVASGDVLVSLDANRARAQLEAARAREAGLQTELAHAERELERIKKLDYPTVSEPERERYQLTVDSKRAALMSERAEVKRLQVVVSQHTLRAPFAGVIRARHVDPGDWVSVGKTVVEVVALDAPEIHVDVSAAVGANLHRGDKATLVGPTPAAATIAGIVPALATDTGAMRVRLEPTERPDWMIAGMPIDVEFQLAMKLASGGVTVSRDALVRGPVDVRVIKAVDGTGVPVTVEIIASSADLALVRGDGLAAGDKVVVRGNERLRPGQPLQVKE